MKIQLSEHFTYKKLLRFVLPSIIMMIFTSIYSVVDGLFVSNFVGKTALAAINYNGIIRSWIYDWYRRQRNCCQDAWRKKQRKGK